MLECFIDASNIKVGIQLTLAALDALYSVKSSCKRKEQKMAESLS